MSSLSGISPSGVSIVERYIAQPKSNTPNKRRKIEDSPTIQESQNNAPLLKTYTNLSDFR